MKKYGIIAFGIVITISIGVICLVYFRNISTGYREHDGKAEECLLRWYGDDLTGIRVIDNWQWERSIDPVRSYIIRVDDNRLELLLNALRVKREDESRDGDIFGYCIFNEMIPGEWIAKYGKEFPAVYYSGKYNNSFNKVVVLNSGVVILQIITM